MFSFSTPDHAREETADAVVAFMQYEPHDETANGLQTKTAKNIKWLANKRGFKNVVLHSFAHLSVAQSSSEFAREQFDKLAARLTGNGYNVLMTPFGYSCEWNLNVYGHHQAKIFKDW